MKSERHFDIPEKREAFVPMGARSERFAVWRVARERWGPAFRTRDAHVDMLFCGIVLSGQLHLWDGRRGTLQVDPGEMLLAGAGGPRGLAVHGPQGVEIAMWVALEGVATDMARSAFPPLPVAFPLRRVGAMESLFGQLLDEAADGGPDSGRVCACLAEAILLQAARACREHASRRSRREEQFLRVRRYVLDHLAEPLTVTGVAREMGISRVYLHRLFREYEGQPPQIWIQRHRMSYAASMLQDGGRSVKDVAFALGWDDPYAFSRSFKHVMGVPPSRMLRRAHKRQATPDTPETQDSQKGQSL